MMVLLDECGLYFRTAAHVERNYLSNLFSDLDTYIWLITQHAFSQKGRKCKQSSHTLSCTSESCVIMVSLLTLKYNMLVTGKEVPFIGLFVMT